MWSTHDLISRAAHTILSPWAPSNGGLGFSCAPDIHLTPSHVSRTYGPCGKNYFCCHQNWLSRMWPPLVWRCQTEVSGFLGLRAPDRQCLGFKCGKHQREGYWISSQFLSCLCSSLLLQAANRLHPTGVLVEEHKRAKSANPLNMTVRQPSVLNSVTFCCCSLQIVSVSGLGGSVYTKPLLQQVI